MLLLLKNAIGGHENVSRDNKKLTKAINCTKS